MKRLYRRDKAEPAIIEAVIAAGGTWQSLNYPVDGAIGWTDHRGRHTVFVEIKSPGKNPSAEQQDFLDSWAGWATVIRSPLEALDLMGKSDKSPRGPGPHDRKRR